MFIIDNKNNMTIVQGDSGLFSFKLENYELISGEDSVTFSVAQDIGLPPVIQLMVNQFNSENGADFVLTPDVTNIEAGTYLYDIQVNTATGIVDTVIIPTSFTVLGGITDGS